MNQEWNDFLAELFREMFEGVASGASGTWVVEKSEGIFDALGSVSAVQASFRGRGWRSSLGAHAYHLGYYLSLFNSSVRGEKVKPDWEGSWAVQEFSEVLWQELKERLRMDFEEAMETYRSGKLMSMSPEESFALPNIVHAAFHLGALRALLPIAQASA